MNLSQLLFVLVLLADFASAGEMEWKVAVYEHEVFAQQNGKEILSRAKARNVVGRNIEVFTEQARIAAAQLAKMIVFPENGLYGNGLTRDSIVPYLEDIPDPKHTSSCPCNLKLDNITELFIQTKLSCMAKHNSIYVAANTADRKFCIGQFSAKCPPDGRWQFNTAVVYNPEGCLVARYHKQNLFFEEAFNTPPKVELSTFWTPFGKFGLAVCFDILFKSPIVDLVTKHGVETIIFPTAWMDALPLLSAIEFHSAWANGMKVNVLAANQYRPEIRMSGSGIYSHNGVVSYTCRNPKASERLVVANLSKTGVKPPAINPTPLNISMGELIRRVEAPQFTFTSLMFHQNFKFVRMVTKSGMKKVCENNFCCFLRYEMEEKKEDELYAFGAFSGKHTHGNYFIQACVFVRCRLVKRYTTCGSAVSNAKTRFLSFYIDGTFNSSFVFPIVFTTNYTLPERDEVLFGKQPFAFMESKNGVSKPVVAAGLLGRLYDKDGGSVLQSDLLRVLSDMVLGMWSKFRRFRQGML